MSDSFDVDRMLSLSRVTSLALSPCSTWLAVAVARHDTSKGSYVGDIWRVSLTGAHDPIQLTRGPSDDGSPCFRADGALGFVSDRPYLDSPGGEEQQVGKAQVWLLDAIGGEPRRLTDEPLGVCDFRFPRKSGRMVVIAPVLADVAADKQRQHVQARGKTGTSALRYTTMGVRHWDHWLSIEAPHFIAYDDSGGNRRDLTPHGDRHYRESAFGFTWDLSVSGRWIAAARAHAGTDRLDDHAIELIDTNTGEARILIHEERVSFSNLCIAPDECSIAATKHKRSKEHAGKEQLCITDLAGGNSRIIAEDWDAWPSPATWTPDGKTIIASADLRATHPVVAIDTASGAVTRVTPEDVGGCHSNLLVAPNGTTLVGIRHTILQPPEPFCVDLKANSTPKIVAHLSGFSSEEARELAKFSRFEITSDDGTRVESLVLEPVRNTERKRPALLWIHGGPIGASADGWHWRWNPLIPASAGYVVVLPNPRGSTGYGQAFVEGIWNNRWGKECYQDLMKVTDEVERFEQVDSNRIGAMGGSFGGYMSNWIGGHTARFKCLVTHASLFSLPMFYGTTDYPSWVTLELGANPYSDPDIVDECSPHRRVANWKTPTLITHGEKDYRVPISEGLALFEALQLHGVESELVVFPDENHWIQKPANIRYWYECWQGFVSRYLQSTT